MEQRIKEELSGMLLKTVLGLLLPTDEFEVNFLREAIKTNNNILFNDDDAIIQVLCNDFFLMFIIIGYYEYKTLKGTKNNQEIKNLSQTYRKSILKHFSYSCLNKFIF